MWMLVFGVASIGILMYKALQMLLSQPRPIWSAKGLYIHGPNSRKLGHMEMMYAELGASGIYNISFALILQSQEKVTESTIWEVLLALSQRHPMLQMRLGKTGKWFTYMIRMEDFVPDFKVCTSTDWKAVMEDDMRQVFDAERGLLWKVRFLPRINYDDQQHNGDSCLAACVFTFHHAIVDGISCCHLFKQFLDMIGKDPEINDASFKSTSLLPPVEFYVSPINRCLKWNMYVLLSSATILVYYIIEKLFPEYISNKNVPKIIPQQSKILTAELSKEQTSQLLSACKRNNVTVGAALQVAASVANILRSNEGRVRKHYHSLLMVNMRPYLADHFPKDYLGFYVSVLSTHAEIDPKFWYLARKTDRVICRELNREEHITSMALLPAAFKQMTSKVQLYNSAKNDLFLSNFGNISFLDSRKYHKVNLKGLFVASSLSGMEQDFANFVVTVNGKLFWTCGYHAHVTSESKAETYKNLVIQTLLHAIEK